MKTLKSFIKLSAPEKWDAAYSILIRLTIIAAISMICISFISCSSTTVSKPKSSL